MCLGDETGFYSWLPIYSIKYYNKKTAIVPLECSQLGQA